MPKQFSSVLGLVTGLTLLIVFALVLTAVIQSLTKSRQPSVPGGHPSSQGYPLLPVPSAYPVPGYPASVTLNPLPPAQTYPAITVGRPTLTPPPLSNDPKQFTGLPRVVAGYKVLAIRSAENTLCWPPDYQVLVLQTNTADELPDWPSPPRLSIQAGPTATVSPEKLPRPTPVPPETILQAMAALGMESPEWSYELVGPDTTLEEIAAQTQYSNQMSQPYGCITTGPPVLITPVTRIAPTQ